MSFSYLFREPHSTRATASGFPQRTSIGPLKMFTTRKKHSPKIIHQQMDNKLRGRSGDPKWKKFVHKDNHKGNQEITFRDILE